MQTPIEIYFSPKGGCTGAVVRAIYAAKKTILVQAYSFSSTPITNALIAAHDRGIDVRIILDRSQEIEKYSTIHLVQRAKISVWIDAKHAIAHNKVMVIDDETVVTGSFNFTSQAEHSNAENLLIIHDKAVADQYAANWNTHLEHSDKYHKKSFVQSLVNLFRFRLILF